MSHYDADALRAELAGYKARGLTDRAKAVEALLRGQGAEAKTVEPEPKVEADAEPEVETAAVESDRGAVSRRAGGRRS
jgi:hypothetical protein